MTKVIVADNVGKKYFIQHEQRPKYFKFSDQLFQFGKQILDPFNRRERALREEFWAVSEINFNVNLGDRVGIIGRNGAGKSTLLKLLSRITEPTTGKIGIKGRVASLLEVGTGFHPELTGRENIFLNGSILGMTRRDIQLRFDEIVSFAEVERFLDTPVKRYSSGMYVRLAFSVAAHLEPDILIVDEVLAVGDLAFQKKCLGKMEETGQSGRTLLFVSHNHSAVNSLCNRAISLLDGRVGLDGNADEVIEAYLAATNKGTYDNCVNLERLELCKSPDFQIDKIEVINVTKSKFQVCSGDDLSINFFYQYTGSNPAPALVVSIKNSMGVEVVRFSNLPVSGTEFDLKRSGIIVLTIPNLPLVKGSYMIDVGYNHAKVERVFYVEELLRLEVGGADVYNSGLELDQGKGMVWMPHHWTAN